MSNHNEEEQMSDKTCCWCGKPIKNDFYWQYIANPELMIHKRCLISLRSVAFQARILLLEVEQMNSILRGDVETEEITED